MSLRRHSLRVHGIRTPLIEAGAPEQDEAVIFVHGNPGSSEDWATLVAGAGEFTRAVAMDMPGFGQADKPADFAYTVDGYAEHLARLLDVLGTRRAHLVLHDFGGPWGLAFAAKHAQRVASFTLIDTGVLPGYRWHALARIWRTPVIGELFNASPTRRAFGWLLSRGNPRSLPSDFIDRMFRDYDRGTRRAVLKLYRATDNPGRLAAALQAALRPHRHPALVIWGRHDLYLSAHYALRQRETFADAQVHVLENSGHWPFVDEAESVSRLVIPFLRSQVDQP